MVTQIKRMWRAAPVATFVLGLSLAVAVLFAARTVVYSIRFNAATDQPIAAWMTPRFISHAYHIPRDIVIDALDVPMPPPNGPMTLAELAAMRGVPVETVLDEARALVAEADTK